MELELMKNLPSTVEEEQELPAVYYEAMVIWKV
jgi:hypothetical protein